MRRRGLLPGTAGVSLSLILVTSLVGMSAAKEVGDEERARLLAAITQDSADLLREYTRDSGLVFEFGTNVATAKGGVRS